MDALRKTGPNAAASPLPFTSTANAWTKVGDAETRPDGTIVERFASVHGATRELMRNPSPCAAAMLFGGPALRGWQNSKMLPMREREVHATYRSLVIREQYRATMWVEDAKGVITETPLTLDPVLGSPKRRSIERFPSSPDVENPEWIRYHHLIETSL